MKKVLFAIALACVLGFFLFSNDLNFFASQETKLSPKKKKEIAKNNTPKMNINTDGFSSHSVKTATPEDRKIQKVLQDTFKLHQRFMEKCFIKHYERKLGDTQAGQIILRFKIIKSGKLKNIAIKQSDFKDDKFHDCLTEVISRVRIKLYNGKPQVVDFPILVTLPN